MTDKSLERLSRADLLEILVEQSQKIDQLEQLLADAHAELENRKIIISKAGSIAEASIHLNRVFQAAEEAAKQYLDNIEELSGAQKEICANLEAESQKKAFLMLAEAKKLSEKIINEAKQESQKYWDEVNRKALRLMTAHRELQQVLNAIENDSGSNTS